jgi:hypothetical protein
MSEQRERVKKQYAQTWAMREKAEFSIAGSRNIPLVINTPRLIFLLVLWLFIIISFLLQLGNFIDDNPDATSQETVTGLILPIVVSLVFVVILLRISIKAIPLYFRRWAAQKEHQKALAEALKEVD